MKRKFIISFLVSLLVFGAGYGYIYHKLTNTQTVLEEWESDIGTAPVEEIEDGNEVSQLHDNEILFLMVGVDTADISRDIQQSSEATGVRSDTMMLVKVNFSDGSVKMMSLPRDSRVPVKGRLDKLNHAHSYGGMRLLMQTVRDFTNLDVDFYVRVDYSSVESIVDAIGGVDVTIDHYMKYNDGAGLNIDFSPGDYTLDGKGAIEFLRYRSYPRGDVDRVENQQYFMTELIKQTLTPRNILKLPKLFNVYVNNVDTNIRPNVVARGISLANKLDSEKIVTCTLPGEGRTLDDGLSYFIIYENQAKEEIEEIFGDYLMED